MATRRSIADRRTVWKVGGNWEVLQEPDLRLRAEFVSQTVRNPQIGFPAATPALEAAFPGRFERDGGGNLVRVDLRPVNGERSRRDTIRWGVNFSKPLKSAVPSREQIQALRARFGGQKRAAAARQHGPAARGRTARRTRLRRRRTRRWRPAAGACSAGAMAGG